MARDYFEDITPPESAAGSRKGPMPERDVHMHQDNDMPHEESEEVAQVRGIRSIPPPLRSRSRMSADMRGAPAGTPPRGPRRRGKWLMWSVAILSLVAVGGFALFALRPTAITVIPKSHIVVFDDTSQFTAYPVGSAATGTLTYTVQTIDLEDSEVVAAQGTTTKPPAKASGTITVINSYSAAPVRLIKNTRFETPEGLVYRTPTEVVIPGKKGTTPGQVDVTVAADATGSEYNIGPVTRFTLPGLKSSPDMYRAVYARSSRSMTGGSSGGTEPAVAPATLSAAIANIRARLETKAHDAIQSLSTDSVRAFPATAQITYQDLPSTQETGDNVRIHESVHVTVPVFPADAFAQAVAAQVSADAGSVPISLMPGTGFTARILSDGSILGADPLSFALGGQGQLVWIVDSAALAEALAGRDGGAFQTIVNGFPGIQEAHARIEPFWRSSFPSNPSDIKISVESPQSGQ
ncbi:baseplate J/gp47 family protein [Candidatus Kaiserbacteria bacterium]|nr:baseplate J/gp47 family protein [Candidatus Kaiserbacteria bacterium]